MTGELWIDFHPSDEDEGSARWGNVTDLQIDTILACAVRVLGEPDTLV